MAKYINKDILMTQIDKWDESARNGTNPNCKNGNEYEAAMDIAIMVEEAPAADVRENIRGEWIPVINGRGGSECSKCHAYAPSYQSGAEYTSPFCPNCGAQMDGRREEEHNAVD